ncbi:MAG TPA: hypothetical protein VJT09_06765 [Pyrinomonadaceae bacterium]|nr:hypothetical protein [Pyrinomonadaceae bacterium]
MSKALIKRNAGIILSLALSVIFSTACNRNANTGNGANAGNTTTNTAGPSGQTGGAMAGSPTDALKTYYEAARNKDIETARKYLSAGTLRLFENEAKKAGKTLDEALRKSIEESPVPAMPEFSNERITGDTATVDIKSKDTDEGGTMPMVKEGGQWKIALDKIFEELKKDLGTDDKAPGKDDDEHGGNDNK